MATAPAPAAPSARHALDFRCINALRGLAIDAIEAAKSGHPGLPLGAAPMAYVLFDRHLSHAPGAPDWANRDRFVLSAGHGSMLLYGLLHLYGYGLHEADLRAFRQLGSRTPGHPERGITPGVEANTGPLGQGAGNSVGMAVAEAMLAARFNRPGHAIVDHRTWALVSDGDLMEGVSYEAASLAGHWRLGKLTWLYDANAVTLDGPASRAMSEDMGARFRAMQWQVLEVSDGDHDLAGIDAALAASKKEPHKPTLIIVHTTIGYGSPNKQGSSKSHGAPLGPDEARATKQALELDDAPAFTVAADVRAHLGRHVGQGRRAVALWQARRAAWAAAHPALAAEFQQVLAGTLPTALHAELQALAWTQGVSTREASGQVLQAAARALPQLLGGDADLSASTLSSLHASGDFAASSPQPQGKAGQEPGGAAQAAAKGGPAGRNLRFGVREHAMATVANGLAYHGGVLPFVATFFVFSDYLRPALRMAAIAELGNLWLFTHDSAALGEDGPTHQPIEHLASLRAMPKLVCLRPADAHETRAAWYWALKLAAGRSARPVALVLSRQKLGLLAPSRASIDNVGRGAYILREAQAAAKASAQSVPTASAQAASSPSAHAGSAQQEGPGARPQAPLPDALLLATGAEVHLALRAAEQLGARGLRVRVVSMPSWELFAAQDAGYRDSVLPPAVRARVSVEAASSFGWSQWTGTDGENVGIDSFGVSAPGEQALEALGVSVDHVVAAVLRTVERAGKGAGGQARGRLSEHVAGPSKNQAAGPVGEQSSAHAGTPNGEAAGAP